MNANLGPQLEEFVTGLVDTGLYQSQSEVIRAGLRLLKEREDDKSLRLAGLRRAIARGSAQADRGELVDGSAVFRRLRQRPPRRQA